MLPVIYSFIFDYLVPLILVGFRFLLPNVHKGTLHAGFEFIYLHQFSPFPSIQMVILKPVHLPAFLLNENFISRLNKNKQNFSKKEDCTIKNMSKVVRNLSTRWTNFSQLCLIFGIQNIIIQIIQNGKLFQI